MGIEVYNGCTGGLFVYPCLAVSPPFRGGSVQETVRCQRLVLLFDVDPSGN